MPDTELKPEAEERPKTEKQLKRLERKRNKVIAEYQLTKSNDEVKRRGEMVSAPAVKKLKIEPAEGPRLTPEELKLLKQQLRERKKYLMNLPRFKLQYAGQAASLTTESAIRVPVLMTDIQQLLLYAAGGNTASYPPERWCALEKYNRLTHIVAVVLEGLSCHDFFTYEHHFPNLTAIFPDRVEVFGPSHYKNEVAQEIACVPISNIQKRNILAEYGTMEAVLSSKQVFKVFRALFPINFKTEEEIDDEECGLNVSNGCIPELPPQDMFPRTYLLLSLQQMMVQGFPLPFEYDKKNRYSDFKMTKPSYREVSEKSPIFAVDCEMCQTSKAEQELTHIALINENLETVYSTYVKPHNPITDYITRFSGITKEILDGVTTTLEDVHEAIQRILPDDAILIGHSLNCDLRAMKMIHPYVIDTSVSFNMTGLRNRKSKLSYLVSHFLGEEIQQGHEGHCPQEDAGACMKLIKLKLANGYQFGDSLISTVDDEQKLKGPQYQLTASIFNRTEKANQAVSVIGTNDTLETYKTFAVGIKSTTFKPIPVKKPKHAIKKLSEVATSNKLTIAHVDISSKLQTASLSQDEAKLEKVLKDVDKWCEAAFRNVSLNGMCVVLFAGDKNSAKLGPQANSSSDGDQDISTNVGSSEAPSDSDSSLSKKKRKRDNDDSPSKKKKNRDSSSTSTNSKTCNDAKIDESNNNDSSNNNSKSTSPSPSVLRRNGVCFIRVNVNRKD